MYGDIGTSPLYALKECFGTAHGIEPTPENVLGVLSLIVWSLNFVVSYKYIAQVMRADNRGEGGILACWRWSAAGRGSGGRRWCCWVCFGAALLYGDGVITPAISVLGAIEGLEFATPVFRTAVVPLTICIIFLLFLFRNTVRPGSARCSARSWWCGSVVIAVLGLLGIMRHPACWWRSTPGMR